MPEKCGGITKAGRRCDRPVIAGKQHCLFHDPQSAELRRAGSRAGGKARSNAARAARQLPPAFTSDELLAVLSGAIRKVEAGELEPGPANAMSSLARAMTSIREVSEVERRLAELEERVGVADTTRRRA